MSRPLQEGTCTAAAAANKTATTLFQFAQGLETSLSKGSEIASSDLENYIFKAAASPTFPAAALAQDVAHRLESVGRRIWNICLQRQHHHTTESHGSDRPAHRVDTRARLFGYLVIGLGMLGRPDANAAESAKYLLKLGITLSKVCLNQLDLETARTALQKVVEYLNFNANGNNSTNAQPASDDLWTDYYTLRIALKDGRLDLAEHMYSKATQHTQALSTATLIALVQILTQIGKDLIARGDGHLTALPWFRRAVAPFCLSTDSEGTQASGETQRLHARERARLTTQTDLLTCLVGVASRESLEAAKTIVAAARAELGESHGAVLEMMAVLQVAECDWYALADTLCDMLHDGNQMDALERQRHQRFVLEHLEKMAKTDAETAAVVLDHLIPRLLLQPGVLLDKAVVLRLRIDLRCVDTETIWYCFHLLDCVQYTEYSLGSEAVQEINLMLWNIIQPLFHDNHFAQVISWCQLALHAALSASASSSRAKFTRKKLACQVQLSDYADALSTLETLSAAEQNHVATRFLLFRLALRTWDQHLARSCIQFFARLDDRNQARDALYACVGEAQRTGDRLCAVEALRGVSATWRGEAVASANLPSLLRCTIRLLALVATESTANETSGQDDEGAYSAEIVQSFQHASEFVANGICDGDGNKLFDGEELHWFATTSYNLGVTRCTSWEPGLVVSLFTSCLVFLAADDDVDTAVLHTSLRCHFVLAALYRAEAQRQAGGTAGGDMAAASLYVDAEKNAASFKAKFRRQVVGQGAAAAAKDERARDADLWHKYGILCVLEMEAALARGVGVEEALLLVQEAQICEDVEVLKAMGDCIIHGAVPVEVLARLVKRIVNEIFHLEPFDSDVLARYLCFMTRLLLVERRSRRSSVVALSVFELAVEVAGEAKSVGSPFPHPEVHWLAATAFNHGLERCTDNNDNNDNNDNDDNDNNDISALASRWLDGAVVMARYVDDDGNLAREMDERRARVMREMRRREK